MESCPVCLGNGKRLFKECYFCGGKGFVGKISKNEMVEFIEYETQKAGFEIILQDSEKTNVNGIECSAFFDARGKILAVAKKHINFFENLIHEFCHLRQFDVNCPAWANGYVNGVDSSDILDSYLNGNINLDENGLEDIISRIIELEWDCECRVKEYLKEISDYPEESLNLYNVNAFMYMRFYRAVGYFKKWHLPGKDFLSMGIHYDYMKSVVGKTNPWQNYNSPISKEEIELFKKCFE